MDKREMLRLFLKLGREARKTINGNPHGKRREGRNYFGDVSLRMDLCLENLVKEKIRDTGFRLITEERPEPLKKAQGIFILDPLDGSKNYETGFPAYAFAICGANCIDPVINDIEASLVVDLASGNEYYALKDEGAYANGRKIVRKNKRSGVALVAGDFGGSRGAARKVFPRLSDFAYVRMLGASILDMTLAARGTLDAYMDVRGKMLVTHTAGIVLMKEAGLIVTDKRGNKLVSPLHQDTLLTVIAAWDKKLHKKLVDISK